MAAGWVAGCVGVNVSMYEAVAVVVLGCRAMEEGPRRGEGGRGRRRSIRPQMGWMA